MNVCSLSGCLTWRPELRYQSSGKPELTFRLTVPNGERDATESLQGTLDHELRPLVSKLIVQLELADDACKHPNTLKL